MAEKLQELNVALTEFATSDLCKQSNGGLIIILAQFDADALAAAVLLRRLVSKMLEKSCVKTSVRIMYCGCIGHPQSRAALAEYDYVRTGESALEKFSGKKDDLIGSGVVLVDSSAQVDARIVPKFNLEPLIVIDHHHLTEPQSIATKFSWVDVTVGAASTLVAELALAYDSALIDQNAWTLLAAGIYIDTDRLTHATPRDITMYGKCIRGCHPEAFRKLIDQDYPTQHLHFLAKAESAKDQRRYSVVAGLDQVPDNDRDCIATVADSLVNMPGITLAVVWGVVENQVLVSIRTKGHSESIGRVTFRLFANKGGSKPCNVKDGVDKGGACLRMSEVPSSDLHQWFSKLVHGQ